MREQERFFGLIPGFGSEDNEQLKQELAAKEAAERNIVPKAYKKHQYYP